MLSVSGNNYPYVKKVDKFKYNLTFPHFWMIVSWICALHTMLTCSRCLLKITSMIDISLGPFKILVMAIVEIKIMGTKDRIHPIPLDHIG